MSELSDKAPTRALLILGVRLMQHATIDRLGCDPWQPVLVRTLITYRKLISNMGCTG